MQMIDNNRELLHIKRVNDGFLGFFLKDEQGDIA